MNDDTEGSGRPFTRGTIRSQLVGLLAARGVQVTPTDRLKWALLEECIDTDISISLNGQHATVLHRGFPIRTVNFDTGLQQLANHLAVQMGGSEQPVLRSVEEIAEHQRRTNDIYHYG